jgi:hypothetical protein
MGAILQHEVCDVRLLALEEPARLDMQGGLAGIVGRTMQVAAAAELERTRRLARRQSKRIEALRAKVAEVRPLPWIRRCWMCGAPGECPHREPELVSFWKGTK